MIMFVLLRRMMPGKNENLTIKRITRCFIVFFLTWTIFLTLKCVMNKWHKKSTLTGDNYKDKKSCFFPKREYILDLDIILWNSKIYIFYFCNHKTRMTLYAFNIFLDRLPAIRCKKFFLFGKNTCCSFFSP